MKPTIHSSLLAATLLALVSCSSTPSAPTGTVTAGATYQEGVPGGAVAVTYKLAATVTAIDADKRTVTLAGPDGRQNTVKCGPQVVNFDQIHVGDQVKTTVCVELEVSMATAGAPAGDNGAVAVALAPEGDKPAGLLATTMEVTAKISAINLKHHQATLQFPDGSTQTVAVRKDVDLTQRKVGEEVVIRFTGAVALSVEKP